MEYARMRRQRAWIKRIFGILLVLIMAGAAAYYYFQIYLNEIQYIENISTKVRQGSKLSPPETVEVKLRSGNSAKAPAKWDTDIVDTSKLGLVKIKGRVEGYDEDVNMDVQVHAFIEKVEEPSEVCIAGTKNLKLPQSVAVTYSMKTQGTERVIWETDKINLDIPGKYEVQGKLEGQMDCTEPIKCNLEVIGKDELLRRIVVQNEFASKPELKKTLEAIKKLPDEILEVLLKSSVKIKYVNQRITDIPEFSSLKEAQNSELRVFGVFKYPDIVVDVNADSQMYTDAINTFETITIHEIGHAYDRLYNLITSGGDYTLSSTSIFHSAFQEEASKLFNIKNTNRSKEYNDYYINSQYEYFAQSFAYYFTNDQTRKFLEQKAPESYKFMKDEADK